MAKSALAYEASATSSLSTNEGDCFFFLFFKSSFSCKMKPNEQNRESGLVKHKRTLGIFNCSELIVIKTGEMKLVMTFFLHFYALVSNFIHYLYAFLALIVCLTHLQSSQQRHNLFSRLDMRLL